MQKRNSLTIVVVFVLTTFLLLLPTHTHTHTQRDVFFHSFRVKPETHSQPRDYSKAFHINTTQTLTLQL